jgi:hypothetical protein
MRESFIVLGIRRGVAQRDSLRNRAALTAHRQRLETLNQGGDAGLGTLDRLLHLRQRPGRLVMFLPAYVSCIKQQGRGRENPVLSA